MAAASAGRVAQRPHPGRGVLQPDRGVRGRRRVGTREGVVRDGRRLRPHARDLAAVRRLPHGPRGRPGRGGALAGGRARARDRAGHARALRPADGRGRDRPDGRAAGPPGPAGGGGAAAGRRARSSPRRCGRSRCCGSPRTGRRWRRGCWSEACGAAEGNAVRAAQMLAPLVDARLACGDVAGARVAADQLADLRGGVRHPADRRPRRPRGGARGDRRRTTADAAESARRALAGVRRARDAVRRRRGAARARPRDRRPVAGDRRRRGPRRARRLPRARRVAGGRRRRRARCATSAGAPAAARASPASSPRASWRCST